MKIADEELKQLQQRYHQAGKLEAQLGVVRAEGLVFVRELLEKHGASPNDVIDEFTGEIRSKDGQPR